MAMSAVCTTVGGRMVHEVPGGAESFYTPDTLGSLAEARSATGTKTYQAEYWPYGEVQAETGANPSPWGFVGLLGYLRDLAGLLYVRARHYRPGLARWQTVDPLWPEESAYGYVEGNPITWIDRDGQVPERKTGGSVFVPPLNQPCTQSPATQLGLRCAGAGNCVDNTAEYGNSFLHTGNKLDRCASCVSASICDAIAAGNVGGTLSAPIGGSVGISLAAATACQNNCMIEYWRQKKTPLWQQAIKVCRQSGQSSKACCNASVRAEQNGYELCAPKCFPPLGLIPNNVRIMFALDVLHCCG